MVKIADPRLGDSHGNTGKSANNTRGCDRIVHTTQTQLDTNRFDQSQTTTGIQLIWITRVPCLGLVCCHQARFLKAEWPWADRSCGHQVCGGPFASKSIRYHSSDSFHTTINVCTISQGARDATLKNTLPLDRPNDTFQIATPMPSFAVLVAQGHHHIGAVWVLLVLEIHLVLHAATMEHDRTHGHTMPLKVRADHTGEFL